MEDKAEKSDTYLSPKVGEIHALTTTNNALSPRNKESQPKQAQNRDSVSLPKLDLTNKSRDQEQSSYYV